MKVTELKLKISKELELLSKTGLEEMYAFLHQRINQENDTEEWHQFSEEKRQRMLHALSELNEGKGLSHESVLEKYRIKYAS